MLRIFLSKLDLDPTKKELLEMSSPESVDSHISLLFKLLGPIRGNTYLYDLALANAQDDLNKKEELIKESDR
jgi:hypothetical protein